MTSLYTKDSVIGKLRKWFSGIFSEETKPTEQHLFELALSVLALDGFQSVRFSFEHFISEISPFELKSFYYTLNESKIALSDWMENLMKAALSLAAEKTEALVLSVDDTLTEKFGEKFEHWGKLYDHAAHNGSAYLNGHCLVSLSAQSGAKVSFCPRSVSYVDESAKQTANGRRTCQLGDVGYRNNPSGDSLLRQLVSQRLRKASD